MYQLPLSSLGSSIPPPSTFPLWRTSVTAAACGLWVRGYFGTWIHEQGHAVAMRACFQDVRPVTLVRWFGAGMTYPLGASAPTAFGQLLGERKVKLLIASGGVLGTATIATLSMMISLLFARSMVGNALNWMAFWHLTQEMCHLIRGGADFVEIRRNGGPSQLAIAVILAVLPLLVRRLTSVFYSSFLHSPGQRHPQQL